MKNKKPSTYIWFALASLALHFIVFYGLLFINDFLIYSELFKRLDHSIEDKTKDLSTQIELIDINKKQFVEQDKTEDGETPKEADYLSQSDQLVKKETKARVNDAFKNSKASNARPAKSAKASETSKTQNQKQSLKNITASKNKKAGQKTQAQFLLSKRPSLYSQNKKLNPLGVQGLEPSNNLDEIHKRQEALQQQAAEQLIRPPLLQQALAGAAPSSTDDYLEDVIDGDFTRLNTRRFKHYSFYSRVKEQLRSHWNPLIRQEVYFVYSTTRSLASLGKRRTTLRVTLDKKGYLKKIELLTSSDNKKVDNAAIQAFRTAAPFPNPPSELLEKDGYMRVFWDFVLET